jgi:hypothetical protein
MTPPMTKSIANRLAEEYNVEFAYFNGEELLSYTWNFTLPSNLQRAYVSVKLAKEKSDGDWYWFSHVQIEPCAIFNEDTEEKLDAISETITKAIRFYQFEIVPIIRQLGKEGKT